MNTLGKAIHVIIIHQQRGQTHTHSSHGTNMELWVQFYDGQMRTKLSHTKMYFISWQDVLKAVTELKWAEIKTWLFLVKAYISLLLKTAWMKEVARIQHILKCDRRPICLHHLNRLLRYNFYELLAILKNVWDVQFKLKISTHNFSSSLRPYNQYVGSNRVALDHFNYTP